jgi:hypothetical protein
LCQFNLAEESDTALLAELDRLDEWTRAMR